MAAASGVSLRSVQRNWAAHGLETQRVRRYKLSPIRRSRPSCATWSALSRYAGAQLVLSVDEKSQSRRHRAGVTIAAGEMRTRK